MSDEGSTIISGACTLVSEFCPTVSGACTIVSEVCTAIFCSGCTDLFGRTEVSIKKP